MQITFSRKPITAVTFRAFGIEHENIARGAGTRLDRREAASLLLSAFLLWGNLIEGSSYENVSSKTLLDEIERAILCSNAFDEVAGNFKPLALENLAGAIGNMEEVRMLFGEHLVFQSYVDDVFQSIRLAKVVGKSPLDTLKALCEFDYKIYFGGYPQLDAENIYYLMTIPGKDQYAYSFCPADQRLNVTDEGTSPFNKASAAEIPAGGLRGKMHIDGMILRVDAEAGADIAARVVDYLRQQFSQSGYRFEVLRA